MKKLQAVLLILSALLFAHSVEAKAKKSSKQQDLLQPLKEMKEESELPAGLDFERRNASMRRFEISPYGGDLFGDKLGHSFVTGLNIQYNLTPKLAITADGAYSSASAPTGPLASSLTTSNQFFADGGFVITVPALYRSGKGSVEADFFSSIGGGMVNTNNTARIGGYIGGGMKIRPKKYSWLAIRVEIRNYFTSIPNPSGSDFEDELHVRIGPTFLLPPEM